ncbi:STAS domain-containing protein [Catenulispora sp. NF23]|uniref:Anti-sigma factor antagonist n=1 Tax=Catenulispora pinistramenti TaxID=2705254 RepID=A0ABS5KNL5_9ACTN|nr:STAS domain-containing protein [Catenulispora pinistramenti]MBS2532644.1 STAS domain-containing protein [Catenulispora pinistramenti]MBS2547599.1 STAS domain-containing protein [Catenulispora pinistramenti]
MNSFHHTVTEHRDHVLLTLVGELDFAAHTDLETRVVALVGAGQPVVVDCAGITFLDSMGLRALVAGLLAAEEAGLGFELAAPSPPVLRVLELSGTLERFTVRESVPEPPRG